MELPDSKGGVAIRVANHATQAIFLDGAAAELTETASTTTARRRSLKAGQSADAAVTPVIVFTGGSSAKPAHDTH
jgi:hypothetical protein